MKKLYRSNSDRYIAGVCGGLGRHIGIDPVVIRIIWFILALGGIGVLAYILFWIFVPLNPNPAE